MIGESTGTSTSTVGAMYSSSGSVCPPAATVPLPIRPASRSKFFRFDDPPVVGALLGVLAVEVADRLLELGHEFVLDLWPDQHVIGRGADVSRVDEAAERDAACCGPDVRRGVDDGRVLAPQLEHGRGEVLRRRLVDDLADRGASGGEDQVPLLR
jgi:hypothetical protein